MNYKLSELLKDKQLRGRLADQKFQFSDANGVFSVLDFEEKSLYKNHRAAFDQLCKLGGEALLEKLCAEGNTCLTKDKKAMKSGVAAIAGTEQFFLKTNAGPPKVLSSIFYGIAGWAETCGEFDLDAVTVEADGALADKTAGNEAPPEEEPDAPEGETAEEAAFLPDHEEWAIVSMNGGFALFDQKEEKFIKLPCKGVPGGVVQQMAKCQLMDPEERSYGLKYTLEEGENALWGWIRHDCSRILPPIFKEFVAGGGEDPMILGYGYEEGEDGFWAGDNLILWCFQPFMDPKNLGKLLKEPNTIGGWLSAEDRPTENFIWFSSFGDMEGFYYFYAPRGQEGNGYLWFFPLSSTEEDKGQQEQYSFQLRDGVLYCVQERVYYPFTEMSLYNCKRALDMTGFEKLRMVDKEQDLYAVFREGWWAVVRCCEGRWKHLTPYGFTDVAVWPGHYILVDRFGKKGVFNCETQKYTVPCDYSDIQYEYEGQEARFIVSRMGFTGVIDGMGRWVERLHRDED